MEVESSAGFFSLRLFGKVTPIVKEMDCGNVCATTWAREETQGRGISIVTLQLAAFQKAFHLMPLQSYFSYMAVKCHLFY